jgi:YihY family inner membrane protein
MDPAKILERVLDQPRVAYVRDVLDGYGRAPGGLLANGLAFAALFATIPTMLVTLGLAGLLVDDPAVQARLSVVLKEAFPPLAELIDGALEALAGGAAATSIVGVIGLVWSVSQLYVTLDVAFSRIFDEHPERDFFLRTARGFAWVVALIVLVVLAIILLALVTLLDSALPGGADLGSTLSDIVTSPWTMIGVAMGGLMLVYRFLPPRAPRWRAIWIPALAAGLAIGALSQLFVFLAPRLVGVAALAGSLATAFIALAWLSFSFQALLYGASWVRVRDQRLRSGSALASPAPPAEPSGGGE